MSSAVSGNFGIVWPANVKLASLRARARHLPTEPRAVEKADALFDDHQIIAALEVYQRLASESKSAELQAEAEYKSAICLLQLKRLPEAAKRLDHVRSSGAEPWGLLASCQRWLLHIRKGELDASDSICDQLAAIYTFEQLAAAVPSSQRDEILEAFFSRKLTAGSTAELVQVERAMSLDRLFSIDGRGAIGRQIDCIKAIEKSGRVDHANRLFVSLVEDFPVNPYPYYRLSMLARTKGDYDTSLYYVNRCVDTIRNAGLKFDLTDIELERVRTIAATGNTTHALAKLDELEQATRSGPMGQPKTERERFKLWSTLSHLALIRGFLQDDSGQPAQAVETWRKGYLETRQSIGTVDAASDWLIVNVLILGSLSNELKSADVPGLVLALSGSAMPQQFVRVGLTQFGNDIVHSTLLKMWQSPEAKQVARDGFALHGMSYHDRLSVPIKLAGREFARQTAFSDTLTDGQRGIVDMAIQDVVSLIDSKKLGMMDLLSLGLAWKAPGKTGQPFDAAVSRLPDRSKSLAAYIIAHRLAKSGGNLPDVNRWLELAVAGMGDNKTGSAQIRDELTELKSQQGVVTITNPLQREIEVELTRPDGKTEVRTLGETQTLKLPTGSYRIRTLEGQGATTSSQSVLIRPMVPLTLTTQSTWAPGSEDSAWPGPIVRPAILPGLRNWQLFNREPFTNLNLMAGSPDGQLLALGGRDGLARIYRVSDRELAHILPGHGETLTGLSWSADGEFLLTTAYDNLVQLWQVPEVKLVKSFTANDSFSAAALSPDGQQIALGGWDGTLRVCNRDGMISDQYKAHSNSVANLDWSGDGSKLVSCNQRGRLVVWKISEPQPLYDGEYASRVCFSLSPDRTRLAVATLHGGSIDLFNTKTWKVTRTIATPLPSVQSLAWVDDAVHLAAISKTGEINIWDVDGDSDEQLFSTKSKPATAITRLGTDRFAVLNELEGVKIWDTSLSESEVLLAEEKRGVTAISWRPNHDLVAVAFSDFRLCFFDSSGKQAIPAFDLVTPRSLSWSHDGKQLAVGHWDGAVNVYLDNLVTEKPMASHTTKAEVAWARDGRLLTGDSGGEIRLYSDLQQPYNVVTKFAGEFSSPVVSDAGLLVFTSSNNILHCISLTEPNKSYSSDRNERIHHVALDDAGGKVAVTVGDKIEFYEMSKLVEGTFEPLETWRVGSGHVRSVDWSSTGKNLFTTGNDGTLKQLDVDGQVLATIPIDNQLKPYRMSVSSDDKFAVTGTESPFVTFYDLTQGRSIFSVLVLDNDRTLKFYPGGYCAESLEDVDEELVCVTMDDEGVVRMQAPSAFFDR